MACFNTYVNKLPMALSDEEQDKLLKEYYQTKDEKVREKLISHNLRLVWGVVQKFIGVYRDLDELMSIGTLELTNIIDNKFDITKGFKLSTYAWDGIYKKLYYEVNRAKIVGDAIYRTSTFANPYNPDQIDAELLDNENDVALETYENRVAESRDFRDVVEMNDFVEKFLKTLSERDRYIAVHTFGFYGENVMTQLEMAEELGISGTLVGMHQKKIKTSIREYYFRKDKELTYDDEVASAIKYVDETDNEKHKQILEYHYGLNGKEQMTGADIARLMGKNPHNYVTNQLKVMRAKGLIAEESPKIPRDQILSYMANCDNIDENKILAYYFGLNGKPKMNKHHIARKLGTTDYMVSTILDRVFKKIEILYSYGFTCDDVIRLEVYSNTLPERLRNIFNHTFMLNGCKYLTPEQISKKIVMPEDRILAVLDRLAKGYKEFIEEKQPN